MPVDFTYFRRPTITSWLWSTWLRVPPHLRWHLYNFFLLAFSRPSSNAPNLKKLPFGVYVKVGGADVMQEAMTLQFIAEYTSIPVPCVLDLMSATTSPSPSPSPSSSNDTVLLVLSRIPGTPLRNSIADLSKDQITTIANTLLSWTKQLQALQSPYNRLLCGYLGGSFLSYRIDTKHQIGPFTSQNTFHDSNPCCILTSAHDSNIRALAAIIRQKRYDICFVHGNLCPENILVDRRDGCTPVGIVGWECAAWMPSYWELTSGSWSVRGRGNVEELWMNVLVRCLPQYTDELKVDREICKTFVPY